LTRKNIFKKDLVDNSKALSIAASNHLNKNNMKFRFTKDKQSISQAEFERNVPSNWIDLLDDTGYFSWGYFSVTLID
jgi:hypothetical protein